MGLNRRHRLREAPQDRALWQKLYYKHQKTYLRRRLDAIRLLWDGLKLVDVCSELNCNIKSLCFWIDSYLSGGFKQLLKPKVSGKTGKGQLNTKQLELLKFIILHKTPLDYGYDLHRWTLSLLGALISEKWGVQLQKSHLQVILTKQLNLSYQKFHRDYANADKGKQKAFASDLHRRTENQQADEVMIWFDEFSISTRPDASYGWAQRNTSPTIPSNEKKENGIMAS